MRRRKACVKSRRYVGTSLSARKSVKQGGTADSLFVLDRSTNSVRDFFVVKEEKGYELFTRI